MIIRIAEYHGVNPVGMREGSQTIGASHRLILASWLKQRLVALPGSSLKRFRLAREDPVFSIFSDLLNVRLP